MTGQELKQTLNSIADTLDQGAKVFPFKLNEEVIRILSNLDETSFKLISALLNISVENLKKLLPNVISLLETGDKLFGTDEHVKISNFCRALASRPVILSMIGRFV